MKLCVLITICCLLILASGERSYKLKFDDPEIVKKQEQILRLFNYVNQPCFNKEIADIAKSFQFEGNWELWTKPEAAKEFWYMYNHNFIQQNEVFSIFYPEHLRQAVALFKTFYYAKDYLSLYQVAAWARNNVNAGMFVYSLSVAIIHREDTYGIALPPIYEIMPHYFFNDQVINQAQQYKLDHWDSNETENEAHGSTYKGHTLHANYSGWNQNTPRQQSMTYFTEDVGINSYYYYYHLHYPFWMGGKEFGINNDRRGEQYYYVHQQLLARYYLERLSTDFGEINPFDNDFPIEFGYHPAMQYPNGQRFPVRPNHEDLFNHNCCDKQSKPLHATYHNSLTHVFDYQRRLRCAVDGAYIFSPSGEMIDIEQKNGFEMFANTVENNPDSIHPRYFGNLHLFISHLLSYDFNPLNQHQKAPSVLEHFETSLRDPMFYQMYKGIMQYFYKYKNYLPRYTYQQLIYKNVQIQSVDIDRLTTYFEFFYSDLSNSIYVNENEFNENSFNIRARQYRLNHYPFTYTINVHAQQATNAFVTVFIGPKHDEYGRTIELQDNNYNFVEFDRFYYTLQPGSNELTRNCNQSFYGSDKTSFNDMYKNIMKGEYELDGSEFSWTMPNRFILPKGKPAGQTFQFFVFISPDNGNKIEQLYPTIGSRKMHYIDNANPLGYPLDRPVDFDWKKELPNAYMKDIMIYHNNFAL